MEEEEAEEEEEEAGGDSSSDLAESLCQDFALPRLAPSLSLSLFSHTHTQRYRSEIGSLPENSSGSSELGGGGENLPSVAGVTRPYTSPLPQAPVLAFSPSWRGGAAVTVPPRPRDPKCEEGPLPSPSPGRRVGSRMPARPARTAG